MNVRSAAFACFLFLLCCAASGLTQTRLDITLEGPWILYTYQDSSFENGNTVLVAITPGGVVNDDAGAGPKYFHSISVTTGDGYYIVVPSVYCLTFDSHCSRAGITKLDPDGYPVVAAPVNVTAPPSWKWMNLYQSPTFATALILPMPDSYSTDGAWPMHFAPTFDINGNGYADSNTPKHSIALQLHYSVGPSNFGLLNCNNLPSCSSATAVAHTMLQNTGTLRIVMKSPENDDVCDPHVRHAYPLMIGLLGKDNNKAIKVIDPARGIDDSGNSIYADNATNNCLQRDDQNPHPSGGVSISSHQQSKPIKKRSFSAQIGQILDSLTNISKEASSENKDRQSKELLLLAQMTSDIKHAAVGLDDQFPRVSQMARIDQLLKLSLANIRVVEEQFRDESRTKDLASRRRVARHPSSDTSLRFTLPTLLDTADSEIKHYLADSLTKGANDCRAPIMLVQ